MLRALNWCLKTFEMMFLALMRCFLFLFHLVLLPLLSPLLVMAPAERLSENKADGGTGDDIGQVVLFLGEPGISHEGGKAVQGKADFPSVSRFKISSGGKGAGGMSGRERRVRAFVGSLSPDCMLQTLGDNRRIKDGLLSTQAGQLRRC